MVLKRRGRRGRPGRPGAAWALAGAFLIATAGHGLAQAPPAAEIIDTEPALEKAEAAEPEAAADPSAPGMTGTSAGSAPIILVETAYLAHRRGDFQGAIEGYSKIIQRRGLTKKERAVSYLLRGEAQRDAGRPDEAILDFSRALRQWPGYPAAHYFRGKVYEKRGRLAEAHADLARALQLDPLREAYQNSLTVLELRLKEEGLLKPGPPPAPVEPSLPEE